MARQRKKYNLPAVERIELSQRRVPLRAALAAAGILAALALLAVSLRGLLAVNDGWREIESDGSRGVHCGGDFVFSAEVNGAAEAKRLSLAWTEATAAALTMFDPNAIDALSPNLGYLNAHPGEDVALPPALYRALKAAAPARYVFLAPVYDLQRSLCGCQDDSETAAFDPLQDGDLRDFCARAAAFARDPASVALSFPSDGVARLELSDAYAAFLAENGCGAAVDFGWMKNAFIIDYLADCAVSAGLGRGCIASVDGFVRCLDATGAPYAVNLYRWWDGAALPAGAVRYAGPMSLASLRAFPADAADRRNFYVFRDGAVRAPHADLSDGLARASVASLTGASRDMGCGELLTALLPVFISETFAPGAPAGVALVYPEGDGWAGTDPAMIAPEE